MERTRKDYRVEVPSNKKMKCNMCKENSLSHYNYNGTFIWVCDGESMKNTDYTGCANVQFELWSSTDVVELNEFLKLK